MRKLFVLFTMTMTIGLGIASAQVSGGSREAVSAERTAANRKIAQERFLSELSEALTARSIDKYLAMGAAANAANKSVSAASTSFDTVAAPCLFADTTALRGTNGSVSFTAPGNNGGAILNECSNFGVPALSTPNFLAYNNLATYTNGGIAKLPQVLGVGSGNTSVSFSYSGGGAPGFPMAVIALGPGGIQDVAVVTTTSGWAAVTVTGSNISTLLIVGNPQLLVIDNISAN